MSTVTAPFDFEQARFNMIEQQIRPWEVLDAQVLALLGEIKREEFVPEGYETLALMDMEIPLVPQATDGQCMLAPRVEARTLQELALQPTDKVLEIGTGSGYMAALMASQAAHVTTLEIDPTLARRARARLQRLGITNVEVKEADAARQFFAACSAGAPYDAIVLSGSVAEVPEVLLDMLKTGGRLFAVVGDEPIMRATVIRCVGPARFHTEQPWDTVVPRLLNFPRPSTFRF